MHPPAVLPRIAILVSLGVLSLTCAAWADDTPGSRATLKGVTAVKVRVALTSLDAQQDGLRSADLQADAEHRLGEAGVVITPVALALLFIDVGTDKNAGVARYACSLRIDLFQLVKFVRDPTIDAFTSTWSLSRVVEVSAADLPTVRGIVRELVDQFVAAYREQNPKP